MGHLGTTVKFLADNGIPLDRPWGQIQFDTRNGKAIPIHGGSGVSGVWNAKTVSNVVPNVGYTPILAGSSYIPGGDLQGQRSRCACDRDLLAVDGSGRIRTTRT